MYYADIPVGSICCRFDNLSSTSAEKPPTLVILTLAYVTSSRLFYITKGRLNRQADPTSVLAPYRSFGLGAALLKSALSASIHPSTPPPPAPPKDKPATRAALVPAKPRKAVNRAMAHVQVGNDGAKRFYERLGFVEKERYVLSDASLHKTGHGEVDW